MKRTVSFLLTVIMVIGLFTSIPINVSATSSGKLNSSIFWELSDAGVLTISGTGEMPNYFYTSSSSSQFKGTSSIKKVIICDGITSIGNYIFYNCSNLESVTIPNSVTSIGDSAFYYCYSLASITIPDSVTNIGDSAFEGCSNLTSIVIPNSVTNVGVFSFKCCDSLISINVDNNNLYYASIDGVLFNKLKTDLIQYPLGKTETSYIIPDSVTHISNFAFGYNKNLISVTIPINVTTIGDSAFYGCKKLTTIKIPNSVTTISDWAFYECSNLTSIVIGCGITSIGDWAFFACNSLKYTFYVGTEEQWNNISMGYNRDIFNLSKIHYETTNHISSDWIIDIPTTVNASGSKHQECTFCGEVLETATIPQLKPSTPKVTTTNEVGGVQVSWNKISGATKYVVYRRQGGYSAWVNVGTTTGNTLLDKNVKSGIYYVYSVRAYNASGAYSDFVSANTQTRKFMATPKLTTIYNHVNGLAIKWNAVAGVTNGYRVYRRGAGSTYWTYLGTTKNLYFIDSQVKNKSGEYFRYTVIADGGYHSKFDTTGLYLKRLANPTLISATSSTAGITVKWGAVKGTTGYYVYRKTANSGWTRIAAVGDTNSTTFLDKTAKKGTTYTYTVRAVYGATISAYNAGISCKDKY